MCFYLAQNIRYNSYVPSFPPDARSKGTQSSAVEPTQPSSGPVVLNPMMPFWPVPPPMAGPATTLNMGVDYWGTPASVPMHGKVIAAPTSAPSSNSRDIVLSDPAIQVCHCAGFGSPCFYFVLVPTLHFLLSVIFLLT